MRVLKRRYQSAVWWPRTGIDANGLPTYGTARELKVRWEEVNEVYTSRGGQSLVSRSKVYLGEDVREGDVLWKGALADVGDPVNPLNNAAVFEVTVFNKTPNLRATDYLRIAYL